MIALLVIVNALLVAFILGLWVELRDARSAIQQINKPWPEWRVKWK